MTDSILSNDAKKRYRAIGHNLKPIVMVAGNGLSEEVVQELERALDDHELIKVKLAFDEKETRKAAIAEITKLTGAISVQEIGKVVLLFRAAKKPKKHLSNLHRV